MSHPPSFDPQSRTWLELGEVQRLLLEGYPGIVLGLGLDGRVQWANPAAAERLGHAPGALDGQAVTGTLVEREELELRAAQLSKELGSHVAPDASVFSARLQRGWADDYDWMLRHRDGSPLPTRLSLGTLRDHQGQVTGLLAVEPWPRPDEGAALLLTHHDTLTGLPTRAVLPDRAEMAIQRAARQQSVVALMVIEIVGFDALCEEKGHTVGDDLLRATASRLHFELRKTDTAVRVDRGQFAAMLVDLNQSDEAQRVASKIQAALSAPINVGVSVLSLSTRIGVAWFPSHGDQLLPLLQAAEAAMKTVDSAEGGVACAPLAAG